MKHENTTHQTKRAPLWKWILIIALVVALPLFFSFVRTMQTQQVLNEEPGQNSAAPAHKNT